MIASTPRSFSEILQKVVQLERVQGYRNKSAVGGLRSFLSLQLQRMHINSNNSMQALALLELYESTGSLEERAALLTQIVAFLEGAALQSEPSEAQQVDVMPTKILKARERVAPTDPLADSLGQALTDLIKIRPQEAEKLGRLGLRTVRDALYHFPRAHYDYRNPLPIHRLKAGVETTLIGTLKSVTIRKTQRGLWIVEATVSDESAQIRVSWFNARHLVALLKPRVGERIAISGVPEIFNGRLQFAPRDYEFPDNDDATHTNRLVPIYPSTDGLTARWLRTTIRRVLDASVHLVTETLPGDIRQSQGLSGVKDALRGYHFPADEAEKSRSLQRLAFDELLLISLGMLSRKKEWQAEPAYPITISDDTVTSFIALLPFTPTGAQIRCIDTVREDVTRDVPMSRLLQGDVGSGKTVVAAAVLYFAVKAGYQAAIMAPTEILAEQHVRSLRTLLGPAGISVDLLTGSVKGVERKRVLTGVGDGSIDVIVGTQALIQDGVTFDKLAAVVVDEQHRFGVAQRATLRQKGMNPHLLAMTATPIPRTLALTIYGDLDVSALDERPPGRLSIETQWLLSDSAAFRFIREQLDLGHQAYVICPLVEETEGSDLKAATAEHKRLQKDIFPDLRVGLLHGRMKGAEKEQTLREFRDGDIRVLVATSVIEVGIDVPNATVMVIVEANRFGLAQLHQFRGRVGRGAAQSYCLLLTSSASSASTQRLQAMVATDDGFKLAEEDLQLRGPGEFWGARQSGLPEVSLALLGDVRSIATSRDVAEAILMRDPMLATPEFAALAAARTGFWNRSMEQS